MILLHVINIKYDSMVVLLIFPASKYENGLKISVINYFLIYDRKKYSGITTNNTEYLTERCILFQNFNEV